MSQRTTEIKKLHQSKTIVRDKEYYFNTLNIEHDLLKKAADIAERMMTAFMRENKVEVSINADDIANKILSKLEEKLQSHVFDSQTRYSKIPKENMFSYEDEPVIVKTDRIEIKGDLTNVKKTKDSIKENMNLLEDLEI